MQLSLDGEVRGDLCFYFCLYSFQYFAVPPPLRGKVAFGGKVLKGPCTMLGQSPAVTSKSNTYCFCITTRRKRLAAFLKGGRIQSRATKPVAEVRAEGSHLGECEGLPATQDRPRSAHRHLPTCTASQANTLTGATQPWAQATQKTTTKKKQAQLRTSPTKTFGSTQEGRPPSQSRFPRATHRGTATPPTAKPRFSCSQGKTPVQTAPCSPKSLSKQFYSIRKLTISHLSLISSTTGHAFSFFVLLYFLVVPQGTWDLSSLTRNQTRTPSVGSTVF